MSENKKLVVWTDQYDDQWEKEYKDEHPDASDAEIAQAYEDEVSMRFDDEKANLDIAIKRDVLVIKTINRWNGQSIQCSTIHRTTIGSLLERFFDGNTFYVDAETGDFIGEAYHHDGTNRYCFREIAVDDREDDIDELVCDIESGKEYAAKLAELTKPFGGRIAKVYGWEVNANDE